MSLYSYSSLNTSFPQFTNLSTPPVYKNDKGTPGELRLCSDGLYLCTADGWGKAEFTSLPDSSGLDPVTLDFQARAKRNGATFSNSATIPSIDSFIKNLKADGIWELLIDVGVYAGDNLAAALTKIKFPKDGLNSYASIGFGETDYSEAIGLKGAYNKYLDSGVSANSLDPNSVYIAGYASGDFSIQTPSFFGTPARPNSNEDNFKFYINYQGNCYSGLFFDQVLAMPTPAQGGFFAVGKPDSNNAFFQCNDTQSSITVATTTRTEEILFFVDREGYFEGTLKFSCIASGLNTAQSLMLKNRVLTLQEALNRS